MKTKNTFFSLVAGLMALFISCQNNDLNILPTEQVQNNNTQLSRSGESGLYSNGVFILSEGNMTTENGSLGFIFPNGDIENTIFQHANPGLELGNVAQDLYIANNRIYIICQNGDSKNGIASLVVADANTLEIKDTLNQFGKHYGVSPTHLVVVNNERAFVRADDGLIKVNLITHVTEYMPEVVNPAKTKIILYDNKLYVSLETSIAVIDLMTEKISKEISVEGGKIAGITKGSGNTLWVFTVESEILGHLIKVDTDIDEPVDTYNLTNTSLDPTLLIPSVGLCCYTGEDRDILYFRSNAWAPTDVYQIIDDGNYTKNSTLIYRAIPGTNIGMIYGELGVDPTNGELYFGYIKGYDWDFLINGVMKFNPYTRQYTNYDEIDARFCAGIYFPEQFENY